MNSAKLLVIAACSAILCAAMWQPAKDVWLNWGFSNPVLSSLLAMGLGLAVWWTIGLFVYLANKPPTPVTAATTPINQSISNVSGGSTVNQAAGDITVNQGVTEETLREMLRQKSLAGMADYAAKYPHGYVIFGMEENGRILYEKKLDDLEIKADWAAFRYKRLGNTDTWEVAVPHIEIRIPSKGGWRVFYDNTEIIEGFTENQTRRSITVSGMYYELIDTAKNIILVGFKIP